jgi:hypothetical protein
MCWATSTGRRGSAPTDDNGQLQGEDEFDKRLYQALALIERAGEKQREAAATLARLTGLEERVNQVIHGASATAAARIAGEACTVLDATVKASAETMQQAARSAVAAAENLRLPWWLNLAFILLAGVFGPALSSWVTHRAVIAYFQQDQYDQQLHPRWPNARTSVAKADSGPAQEVTTARRRAVNLSTRSRKRFRNRSGKRFSRRPAFILPTPKGCLSSRVMRWRTKSITHSLMRSISSSVTLYFALYPFQSLQYKINN